MTSANGKLDGVCMTVSSSFMGFGTSLIKFRARKEEGRVNLLKLVLFIINNLSVQLESNIRLAFGMAETVD